MASTTTKAKDDLVRIEFEKGVAWVTLNRPEKRNAMNPALNSRMLEVLDELEGDDRCGVLVLTGEGEAFSAGMDLKEYFRDMEGKPRIVTQKARRTAYEWQWRRLRYFEKPTIAMANGWCFGGAFVPLISCDLAIAAEEAQFGLSEVNWGIIPAGNVSRGVAETMRHRDALYYVMTGLTFDGRKAAAMGLVNEAVPRAQLRKRTRELADVLLQKDPQVLKAAKDAFKRCRDLTWEASEDYLTAKQEQLWLVEGQARQEGMKQFLDEKSFRPGLGPYKRTRARK
ncbi:MAG TPA: p-hydroxycinnamoyl CoA hydratase/lyase [Candidatus Polarisedimenticolia bacterium]|jgi:trans-feruloyl-CoA hydratase/vanillin synthase|nr:p-hydroxycinnamoyl CoA hydratase/lyase [Candidatus Polarisedimenticolia bacterium]